MKEDRVLAEKIRGAGGLKVCFGSDEKLLTMGEQCRIADALLLLDTPPSSIAPIVELRDIVVGDGPGWLVMLKIGNQHFSIGDAHDERDLAEASAKFLREALARCAVSATAPLTLDTAEMVCFYEQEFYVLSNFSAFKVAWNGRTFDTSEAAYHWERFDREDGLAVHHQIVIERAASAHAAFRYAQENKGDQRAGWDSIKVGVMRDILRAKVAQHEYVRRKLLETGDRLLVENSWRDDFWGWGPMRDGKNMLGRLWMEVRAELRARADDRAVTPCSCGARAGQYHATGCGHQGVFNG